MAAVVVLAIWSANPVVVVVAIVVWGTSFGGIPAMLQTRMLHTASFRTRDLAAALQTTAFNVGIGGGALVGGFLLDSRGIDSLPLTLVLFVGVAFLLMVGTDALRAARARRALSA